ncbi:uncharacterized protein LOC135289971 isoform X1 [Passer domesticus]|uniref:uncharacterized protein LOC135289971 isoform X1 n=1 Tax=Passer domesticus TaxID=48849 RepID=UPI0030FEDA76
MLHPVPEAAVSQLWDTSPPQISPPGASWPREQRSSSPRRQRASHTLLSRLCSRHCFTLDSKALPSPKYSLWVTGKTWVCPWPYKKSPAQGHSIISSHLGFSYLFQLSSHLPISSCLSLSLLILIQEDSVFVRFPLFYQGVKIFASACPELPQLPGTFSRRIPRFWPAELPAQSLSLSPGGLPRHPRSPPPLHLSGLRPPPHRPHGLPLPHPDAAGQGRGPDSTHHQIPKEEVLWESPAFNPCVCSQRRIQTSVATTGSLVWNQELHSMMLLPSPPHFLPPVQEMIEDLPVLQTHSMKKYFSELPLMTALTSMLRGISTERRKAEISTCAPKRGVLEDPLFRRVILGFYRIKWLTIHQMSPGCKL